MYTKITSSLTTTATIDRVSMYAITTKDSQFLYNNSKKKNTKKFTYQFGFAGHLVNNNKTGFIMNVKNIKVFKIFSCTVHRYY